ncbi:MAG: hypothetical protein ACPGVU_22595 [Limisphaerales bacterium]
MRFATSILLFLLGIAACAQAQSTGGFHAVDIYVDSGEERLAAYQLHVRAGAGVSIVGIEGSEHAAFRKPPYYDPQAMQRNEVKLAAFSTLAKSKLPKGKTRVTTLHVFAKPGSAKFLVLSHSIGNERGGRISPLVTFEFREK